MGQSRQSQREDLLGYLLGALEQEDHRRVDRALSENERLRDELTKMRQQLIPLARVEETEPNESFPAGLARRTCEFVARESRNAEVHNSEVTNAEVPNSKVANSGTRESGTRESGVWASGSHQVAGRSEKHETEKHETRELVTGERVTGERATGELATGGAGLPHFQMSDLSHEIRASIARNGAWSLADYVIASTVVVMVLGLITPALLASRHQSRLLACQDNLRRIGTGLFNYAENHSDKFIPIQKEGALSVAGAYAPVLRSQGFIDQDNVFYCSAATSSGLNEVRPVPTIEELEAAFCDNHQKLAELQSYMGGSYGYTLGYYENDNYICPVNLGRSFRVIMADAPSYEMDQRASANHGGSGQNLLFEDGSIQFARKTSIGFPADSIFENRNGLIAAGTDVNDSVIGSSNVSAWISPRLSQ